MYMLEIYPQRHLFLSSLIFSCLLFILGGFGGSHSTMNGKGGWSYYNPDAVIKVIEPNIGLPKCAERSYVSTKNDKGKIENTLVIPPLCKVSGDGMVKILFSEQEESLCQGNCSTKGATCVALDMEAKIGRCLCPNGIILDHLNPQCTNSKQNVFNIYHK